jgi:hypothetical protein
MNSVWPIGLQGPFFGVSFLCAPKDAQQLLLAVARWPQCPLILLMVLIAEKDSESDSVVRRPGLNPLRKLTVFISCIGRDGEAEVLHFNRDY